MKHKSSALCANENSIRNIYVGVAWRKPRNLEKGNWASTQRWVIAFQAWFRHVSSGASATYFK